MSGRGKVAIVSGVVIVAVVVACLLVAGLREPRWRGYPYSVACLKNVRHILLAMIQYAVEHDDEYPESFGMLLKEGYLNSAWLFVCPSLREAPPEDFLRECAGDLEKLKQVDDWGGYVVVRGVSHYDDADFIVVHEKTPAHRGGRNCGFNDGHVEWLPEEEFQKRMAEQLKLMGRAGTDAGR